MTRSANLVRTNGLNAEVVEDLLAGLRFRRDRIAALEHSLAAQRSIRDSLVLKLRREDISARAIAPHAGISDVAVLKIERKGRNDG